MEQIKRFFECIVPVTACNLSCSYCYIIQRGGRCMKMPVFQYSSTQIGRALTKERLGGTCYFSICGAGETLLPKEIIPIVAAILEQGHFVNLTTNGTLTHRFEEMLAFPAEQLERIHISFSFHYLELLKRDLLDTFFSNVNRMRAAGCSILVQLNLCDEYLPYLDDIRKICMDRVGAPPQLAATRKEYSLSDHVELMTELSVEGYKQAGQAFQSPLFEFTLTNFNVKRKEFCYAGDWSFTIDLTTGRLSRCYGSVVDQNIFEHPEKPLRFPAVGRRCGSLFCMNSSHFMSLGVIPELNTPTYAALRNREAAGWYSPRMAAFLNSKLGETNETYPFRGECRSELFYIFERLTTIWRYIKKTLKKTLYRHKKS